MHSSPNNIVIIILHISIINYLTNLIFFFFKTLYRNFQNFSPSNLYDTGSDRYDDRIAWKYYITCRERGERTRAEHRRTDRRVRGRCRGKERRWECRMVAVQEEREQKVLFHEVSNRGTWRCTFRDLYAHLPSGPSTSSVALSRTTAKENPFLSASMMPTGDEEKTK